MKPARNINSSAKGAAKTMFNTPQGVCIQASICSSNRLSKPKASDSKLAGRMADSIQATDHIYMGHSRLLKQKSAGFTQERRGKKIIVSSEDNNIHKAEREAGNSKNDAPPPVQTAINMQRHCMAKKSRTMPTIRPAEEPNERKGNLSIMFV